MMRLHVWLASAELSFLTNLFSMDFPFRLKNLKILECRELLWTIPDGKVLINTINAYSYNVARKDSSFADALTGCDVLLSDGTSIVLACRFLRAKSRPKHRCTGWDLFRFEMEKLNGSVYSFLASQPADGSSQVPYWKKRNPDRVKPKVIFVGSTEKVLSLIREKAAKEFPNIEVLTYSPPFKKELSREDNDAIVKFINDNDPDLVWIGMSAPKQEKWSFSHWHELDIHCHLGSIGAVFDFYAGTMPRAPLFMQRFGMEWLFRWMKEPRRLFPRYGIGNPSFIWNIITESFE